MREKGWSENRLRWAHELLKMEKMEQAFEFVKGNILGYGGFTSYELVCDLSYLPYIKYDDDQWANAGPGAMRGLNRLFPGIGKNKEECLKHMYFLRDNQEMFLKKYNFPFFEWPGRLTMRAIEHSLCELSKYAKAYYQEGRPRNHYRGTPENMEELKYVIKS